MADEPTNNVFANVDEPMSDYYEKLKIGQAVGLDNFSQIKQYDHQLTRLKEWAQSRGAKSVSEVVSQLRQLANRVGAPTIGNNWAQHLSTYAYLDMQRSNINKEMKEIAPEAKEDVNIEQASSGTGKE